MKEISLGVESGDDWTLERINKGYRSEDILEQCHKLEAAGIDYWMTFLNKCFCSKSDNPFCRKHRKYTTNDAQYNIQNCSERLTILK